MKFTLEIELGNDAMQTYHDVRGAVSDCYRVIGANMVMRPTAKPTAGDGGQIRDENGNTVGKWQIQPDETDDEALAKEAGITHMSKEQQREWWNGK